MRIYSRFQIQKSRVKRCILKSPLLKYMLKVSERNAISGKVGKVKLTRTFRSLVTVN